MFVYLVGLHIYITDATSLVQLVLPRNTNEMEQITSIFLKKKIAFNI